MNKAIQKIQLQPGISLLRKSISLTASGNVVNALGENYKIRLYAWGISNRNPGEGVDVVIKDGLSGEPIDSKYCDKLGGGYNWSLPAGTFVDLTENTALYAVLTGTSPSVYITAFYKKVRK